MNNANEKQLREELAEYLQPYRQHCPTGFDRHINIDHTLAEECEGESRENWLVLPCFRNRESLASEESNWHTMVSMLGGESDYLEIHRFGHWGVGWYEIALLSPDAPIDAINIALDIVRSLENYPILDEFDCLEREHTDAWETFENCYRSTIRNEATEQLLDEAEEHAQMVCEGYAALIRYYGSSFMLDILDDEIEKAITKKLEDEGLPEYFVGSEGANFTNDTIEQFRSNLCDDIVSQVELQLANYILAQLQCDQHKQIAYVLGYLSASHHQWDATHRGLWFMIGQPNQEQMLKGETRHA